MKINYISGHLTKKKKKVKDSLRETLFPNQIQK